ncbi:MAG: glutathione S-transferase family protein [Deltaproteobacteria bacterium]|nr:glutathione S-transferase family protein [Deltaproteobacteria bacterium]
MSATYKIYGNELSPYSVKVRSYLRYKQFPHEWIVRNPSVEEDFKRYAKLPLVPLVVTPQGQGLQDSTPIIEHLETVRPQPALQPPDATRAFLSALIEEYADEWGNKPMFHYRWFYDADQQAAGERLARSQMPGLDDASIAQGVEMIKARMIPRLSFVGSTAATKAPIEQSYARLVGILEQHLAGGRPYLFGGRPTLADFGLFGQLYELSIDPTPSVLLRAQGPHVVKWIQAMLGPRDEGDFEPWAALAPTLLPLLRDEIGAVFLPWSAANARAIAAGEKEFTVDIDGTAFTQEAQKYHAKSLAALKARYAAIADTAELDTVLEAAGCLGFLRA